MFDIINEIQGFLVRHKKYVIDILYSGHSHDPDQYYFRLNVNGSRCMVLVNNETITKTNPEEIIHQLDEGLKDGHWQDEHVLTI